MAEKKIEAVTERDMAVQYKTLKEQYAAEEHVNIMIPPTQLYPEGTNAVIGLNGVNYTIPVGVEFEKGVPKSIYNVWKESYSADRAARAKMKKKLTGVISIG